MPSDSITDGGIPKAGRLRTVLRAVRPDLAPWHASPQFRLLLTAGLITNFGNFLTYVSVPLQIMQLTDNPMAIGLMGLVQLAPTLVCGLWGGMLADALNRRLLIFGTEAGLALLALVLLANTLLPHPQLWVLYVVGGLSSVLDSVQRPALDSLTPQIVSHDQLSAASALQSLRRKLGAIVSPAVAGVLAATAGVQTAYVLDLATFAVSLALLARLRVTPPKRGGEPISIGAIGDGLRYAWRRKDLLGTYVVDVIAMVCAFPNAVFPFLARQLHAPWALGMLYSAAAMGALAVSLTSGWFSRVHRHGRLVLLAAAGTGAAVGLAGVCHNVWLVLLCFAAAGGADMISGLGRDTMWNESIPDELRGRMAGVEVLSYTVGPKLGDARAGWAAGRWGATGALWTGGLGAAVGIAALAVALPSMIAYDSRTDRHAAAVRAQRDAELSPSSATTDPVDSAV